MKTGFFDLRIRGRLMAGFAAMCLVLAATVGYTVYIAGRAGDIIDNVVHHRSPSAVTGTKIVSGVNATLAALRFIS